MSLPSVSKILFVLVLPFLKQFDSLVKFLHFFFVSSFSLLPIELVLHFGTTSLVIDLFYSIYIAFSYTFISHIECFSFHSKSLLFYLKYQCVFFCSLILFLSSLFFVSFISFLILWVILCHFELLFWIFALLFELLYYINFELC